MAPTTQNLPVLALRLIRFIIWAEGTLPGKLLVRFYGTMT